jgi:nucleoside-diphosphate-sugar epimerase
MKVLVTGAMGFVGLNLVRSLLEAGHDVIALDRSPADRSAQRYLEHAGRSVAFAEADITSREQLASVFARYQPQAVIHAAVITSITPEAERDQPFEVLQANVIGSVNVLLAAAAAGVRRAIYISSPGVFPRGELDDPPISEEAPTRPEALYAITKLSSELLWQRLAKLHDLSAARVRIAQPFGPMERITPSRRVTSPIHEWLLAARNGLPIRLPPWRAGKDWTYVRDTGRGVATLATAEQLRSDVYHVACGRLWMVDEVVAALRERYPRLVVETETNPEAVNRNLGTTGLRGRLSIERMRAEFGFQPQYDLRQALAEYHAWLEADGASASRVVGGQELG